jgi:hypothetical protein
LYLLAGPPGVGEITLALRLAGQVQIARGDLISGLRKEAEADAVAGPSNPWEPSLTMEQVGQFAVMHARSRENPAEVLEIARQWAAAEPASADAQMALGEALERARVPGEAVTAYRRALALRPGWADVEVKLADLILSQEFNR